jgi:hypothetical protein
MPNRILRDWTDSTRLELLNAEEERFFIRLIMKADDFGIFHGDPRLLKAALFPLLTDTRLSSVRHWRDKCVTVGLCHLYADERKREFLKINEFNQRTRAKESKFPTHDGHVTVICPTRDGHMLTETETETETEACTHSPPGDSEIPSEDELIEYAKCQGITMDSAKKFWSWTEGNNAWLDKFGRLKKWKVLLKRWSEDDKHKPKNGNNFRSKPKIDRNEGTLNAGKAGQYASVGRVVSNQTVQ